MKKIFIFTAFGTTIKELEGFELELDIAATKISLAVEHSLSFNDIEVEIKDSNTPELSVELSVADTGLYYRANNPYAVFRKVDGLKPTVDLKTESGFEAFLDMIAKGQHDCVITFN